MRIDYESIFELFPEAQIETDNEGQIIIYTGEYERDENNLPPAK